MTGGRGGSAAEAGESAVTVAPAAIEAGNDALDIGAGEAPPGTYVLVYSLPSATEITVGALGTATFPPGAYAYVGSAFGSNGLGRVDRHRRVAGGSHDVTHWHIDYFGGHQGTTLEAVVAAPHADAECRLAAELRELVGSIPIESDASDRPHPPEDRPLDGFGASDCACPTHLVGGGEIETLRSRVLDAFRRIER
ncbi:GIY-YIG nuclease family protein [Halobellus ordinarius]|uniref:GIY-YIG nuclease family protein n=1 Tax=Halobellus ordinarius TaxID=3075120 RepID=UPI002880AC79|nr:GIY-YIG nuclease family protein [Halobellus sp. ZY16]